LKEVTKEEYYNKRVPEKERGRSTNIQNEYF